jgi:cystathionine gamma-synthase
MAVVVVGGNDMRNEEGNTPPLEIPCGNPIPLDEHACSVSLPKWSDVVGYEEGNVAVTSKMVCGYPRFVFHPYVVRLMEVVIEMEKQKGDEHGLSCRAHDDVDCLLLPSYEAACRAHDFLRKAVLFQGTMSTTTTTTTTSTMSSYPDNALQHTLTSSCSINDNNHHHLGSVLRIRSLQIPSNVHALIFPAETKFAMAAKAYWQHTGEIVSSRRAEAALAELGYSTSSETSTSTAKEAVACPSGYPCLHPALIPSSGQPNDTSTTFTAPIHTLLKQRIASITNTCPKSCVYLFPTGMAAIYAALRSARRHGMSLDQHYPRQVPPHTSTSYTTKQYRYPHGGGGTSIVFGFPYLDTLKLCGRPEICPDGVEFFGHGDTCDLQNLELMLQQRRQKNGLTGSTICALLTEFPSNPLLNCHDLSQLRTLADEYNFILIVDDVSSHLLYFFLLCLSMQLANVILSSIIL